ncbi:MAG: tRNA (guanine(10)-N(2))-dimethyltransferase [Archaeoglobaceae archaeon]|nr:tRNA (guanine(10)-N(2))-dimethyltransferase [Archaeoglobaceae archaeon]MDW8013524.1 tRNA (guanine(10)-N(2))-dimethyltransferase [Archaeoglobaceae archaeon]
MTVEEGKAKIILDGVFYNPRMRFCRDLDVLIFSSIDSKEILDSLAASGIRGIRAALEAKKMPKFNDIDKKAVEVIKKNLEINGIDAEVYNCDANKLFREKKFEHVDVDPFGSPAIFIESACFSAKKYLSITATDTAALCGSSTSSGLRKYSAFAVKTDTHHETGLRILLGFIARQATKIDKAIIPIASWTFEHCYRVHLALKRSSSAVSRIYEKIGYIFYCKSCNAKVVKGFGEVLENCRCGGKFTQIGPLWIGEIKDKDVVSKAVKIATGKARKFLTIILDEVDVATSYDVQRVAQKLKISTPPIQSVVEKLRGLGFKASRSHYCGNCVKTDASLDDLSEIVTSLSHQV